MENNNENTMEQDYQRFQELVKEFNDISAKISSGKLANSSDEELDKIYDHLVDIENEIDELSKKLDIIDDELKDEIE